LNRKLEDWQRSKVCSSWRGPSFTRIAKADMLGQASLVSRKWTLLPHPPNIPSFQNANQEMYSLDSKFKYRVIIIMSVCQLTVLRDKVSIFPLQQSTEQRRILEKSGRRRRDTPL
jgi:hypothetical protein